MKARFNGVDLYLETRGGAGPSIVLVHGSWGDHHNWDGVVPLLARSCRVTTYDRRGHSQSERLATQGSIRDDVRDLAALIEGLGIAPAHVVGNSFGAIVTLNLIIARPDLFASAAIHEPPLIRMLEGNPALSACTAAYRRGHRDTECREDRSGGASVRGDVAFGPGAWEQLPPTMRETFLFNAPTWLDEMNEPAAFSLDLDKLSSFGGPLLMSHGDQSPPFFLAILEQIADAVPRAQRHSFRGAGHVPHLSHPDDYALVVGSFITGVAGAA